MKRILYVRSGPYQLDLDSYNSQELGLATALNELGFSCDIMCYTSGKNRDEIIENSGVKIKVLWRKGIRLLRSGIYPMILKKSFLSEYDIVICSEYSQIMSVLLLWRHKNVYIYNGPYYNLFKIKFLEPIYDKLFCKYINKRAKKVFCKTKMSEEYLNKRGITNTLVVGVGLDTKIFTRDKEEDCNTKEILRVMKGYRNFLFVGSISNRKNVLFGIKVFSRIAREISDIQFIIIGKGDKKYIARCKQSIPKDLVDRIRWFDNVKNSQAKYVYQFSDFFLLPSRQEIFGMVLLESMYFGNIVISSNNAGAATLIRNGENGFIIKDFDADNWNKALERAINCDRQKIGRRARETVKSEFTWNKIALKMKNVIDGEAL